MQHLLTYMHPEKDPENIFEEKKEFLYLITNLKPVLHIFELSPHHCTCSCSVPSADGTTNAAGNFDGSTAAVVLSASKAESKDALEIQRLLWQSLFA